MTWGIKTCNCNANLPVTIIVSGLSVQSVAHDIVEIQKRGIVMVVLEIYFTPIETVICVGTREWPVQTSFKTRTTSMTLHKVRAMELAKNLKSHNSKFWLCSEQCWLQSDVTRTATVGSTLKWVR